MATAASWSQSAFTPGQLDRDTLEALFVAREPLVQGIMDGIRDSAASGNKHQRLLIGPRGIGKSHLVALVYHRVRADPELAARLRIAWLPEDPYTVGYAGLLALVLRRLRQDEPDLAWLDERLEEVLDLAAIQSQESALEGLLLQSLDGRALFLLVENLDDLFDALREDGQRKLRAFIQNHGLVTILATTTSLTADLTARKKTFYGFFRTHTLEPFGVAEAAAMLAQLARRNGDPELADLIWSPLGLARVRAVHYLAGGNPRVYRFFFDFLNRESLDDLVGPFIKLMDTSLTPYYQGRMSRLSPLQRGIVDTLRRLRGAVPVKEIARQVMATSQTVSAQLKRLDHLGYVMRADSLGRSNYYELREPLMRLCLEVKEQRGEPIGLFVQFLRVWYSQTELDRLAEPSGEATADARLREAAARARAEADPLPSSIRQDFNKHCSAGDYALALTDTDCIIARHPRDKTAWQDRAWCLRVLGRPHEEQLACWVQVTAIDPDDWSGWDQRGLILAELGRIDEALAATERAVVLKPDDAGLNRWHAWRLKQAKRYAEAQVYRQKAIDLAGEPKTAEDWDQRGGDLAAMDRHDEALGAYREALNRAQRGIRNFCDTLGPVPSTLSARPVPNTKSTHRLCSSSISRSGIRSRTTSGTRP